MIQKLAVVGLGLIGGSLARALRAAGYVGAVTGFDSDAAAFEKAFRMGVGDLVEPGNVLYGRQTGAAKHHHFSLPYRFGSP